MLNTLYGKTFLILGSQLMVTWLSTVVLLATLRNLYYSRVAWISGGLDERGNLDLHLDWEAIKPYFWALLGMDIAVFLILRFFGQYHLGLGIPLFTFWSILTGLELALCLVSVDENLGSKVLALTALITCATGLIGMKSGIDFLFLQDGLFFSLLLLIGYGLVRTFFSISRWAQRLWALFGTAVFAGYLLYDFHQLSALSEHTAANTWPAAMKISISIYLDIINLFLQLLDFLTS